MKHLTKISSPGWLALLTLCAFFLRYPYWEVIPDSFDEINTTIHAFLIAQGKMLPLTGDDAYAGPFYPYLLAALFRLGVGHLLIGRVVVMITGLLTVPVTYAWVVALSGNRRAGLIAALFVAANPDLILVNSHIGGASFLVPFFTTLFLYLLTEGLRRDEPVWLLLAAVSAGLALQANPISGLVVLSGGLWILWQSRHKTRLGKGWPMWPIIIGVVITLIYSPVIYYNLQTRFDTVSVVQERSYLWEDNPSFPTAVNNLKRLSYQTIRQTSGVLRGSETAGALLGTPLIFLALMLAGLVYTTRYISALPLLVLLPFWLILPIVSSHYGFLSVGRFTTQLVPVWTAVMGILLAAILERLRQTISTPGRWGLALCLLLLLLLNVHLVGALFRYYAFVNGSHASGRDILELTRYAVSENRGERVYISAIEELSFLESVPYIPHAAFLIGDIHHEFLPPAQIVGRLFEFSGPAFLLLSDRDAAVVQEAAPLEWVDVPANEEAQKRHYGLYRLDTGRPLVKPDFVLAKADLPFPVSGPAVNFGDGVQLVGCEPTALAVRGEQLVFHCFWQITGAMPAAMYVGFVHLFDPATAVLITQDDHILGQGRYPLNAWQPGEIIREAYTLSIPADSLAGDYQLLLGIYTWPELTRLAVADHVDDVVIIPLEIR